MQRIFVPLLAGTVACSNSGIGDDPADGLFGADSPETRALAERLAYDHLDVHAERLLAGIEGLETNQVQIRGGRAHVRIDQTVSGVPVFGAQAIVHLDAFGDVTGITDDWVHAADVDPMPAVTDHDAVERAIEAEGGWLAQTADPRVLLGVLRRRGVERLVWRVALTQLDGTERTAMPVVFVDAQDRRILWRYDNLQTVTGTAHTSYHGDISFTAESTGSGSRLRAPGSGFGTFTIANGSPSWISSSDLVDVTSSGTSFTDDAAAEAHWAMERSLEYYDTFHGRDGFDGSGGPTLKSGLMTSVVHYGRSYANAFWNGSSVVYGDGDGWSFGRLTALDIAAHEFTHGVTDTSANLIYSGEPGALNESMSDVFGALIEGWVEGEGPDMWTIGEHGYTPSTSGDAMRYMADPTADWSSKDHYASRYVGSQDNGGVHWNSGIGNLAFYLLVEGGNHPRPSVSVTTVDGIGTMAAGAIWFKALTEYMTPTTDFHEARQATIDAATSLYGPTSGQVASVMDAWAEVGVGSPSVNEPDPEPPPSGQLDLRGLSGSRGSQVDWALDIPADATDLAVRITGGTGDADLYLRYGSAPTTSQYDCRPYKSGNEELCEVAAPTEGTWYASIRAYSDFSGVTLTATWTEPAPPEPTGPPDFLDEQGLSDSRGGSQQFSFEVPAGASTVTVSIAGGTGDADLYVRYGAEPTTGTWDCRPYKNGNNETCVDNGAAAGTWYVRVEAYSDYSGVDLLAGWE